MKKNKEKEVTKELKKMLKPSVIYYTDEPKFAKCVVRGVLIDHKVDTYGNIYNKKGTRKMKLTKGHNGYQGLHLPYKQGVPPVYVYPHHQVVSAFLGNPENKPTVNHKNGCKHDNHVSNLEPATRSEQTLHAHSMYNTYPKVTDESIRDICRLLEEGHRIKTVSDMTGFSRDIVSSILHGKTHTHISSLYNLDPERNRHPKYPKRTKPNRTATTWKTRVEVKYTMPSQASVQYYLDDTEQKTIYTDNDDGI